LYDYSTNIAYIQLIKPVNGNEFTLGQLFRYYCNQLIKFILRIVEFTLLKQGMAHDIFLKIPINRQFSGSDKGKAIVYSPKPKLL